MGSKHIEAGEIYENKNYSWTNWYNVKVDTNCLDKSYTDSAAAATAMATGVRTNYGYVGKNSSKSDLTTIMDYAINAGKKTGVLTTFRPYDATPAGFSAHITDRNDGNSIVKSQLSSGLNLIAGHTSYYIEQNKTLISNNGYSYCDNYANISSTMSSAKAVWQFNMEGEESPNNANGYDVGSEILLKDVAVDALNFLDNENGFVLMIENEHIDIYAEENKMEDMVKMVKSFNQTVESVLAWMKETGHMEDTALIVLADHETGGLDISTTQTNKNNKYISTLNGKKLYYSWETTGHTNANVDMFVYNVAPVCPSGLINNTAVFDLMLSLVNNG